MPVGGLQRDFVLEEEEEGEAHAGEEEQRRALKEETSGSAWSDRLRRFMDSNKYHYLGSNSNPKMKFQIRS